MTFLKVLDINTKKNFIINKEHIVYVQSSTNADASLFFIDIKLNSVKDVITVSFTSIKEGYKFADELTGISLYNK